MRRATTTRAQTYAGCVGHAEAARAASARATGKLPARRAAEALAAAARATLAESTTAFPVIVIEGACWSEAGMSSENSSGRTTSDVRMVRRYQHPLRLAQALPPATGRAGLRRRSSTGPR